MNDWLDLILIYNYFMYGLFVLMYRLLPNNWWISKRPKFIQMNRFRIYLYSLYIDIYAYLYKKKYQYYRLLKIYFI